MNTVVPARVIHITDFKRNPAKAVREADPRPLAVLNHSRLEFYAVAPALFKSLIDLANPADLEALTARFREPEGDILRPVDSGVAAVTL